MDSRQFVVGVECYQLHIDDRHRCRDGPKRSRNNARSGNRPASSSASMTCASSASQARSCASASNSTVTWHARLSPTSAPTLEGFAIGLTREQLVAVDQIWQRHRLLAQRVDHVPVIDDVTALAARDRLPRLSVIIGVEPRKQSSRSS